MLYLQLMKHHVNNTSYYGLLLVIIVINFLAEGRNQIASLLLFTIVIFFLCPILR